MEGREKMRTSCHGVKKSSGSTMLFSLGLVMAFSIVMVGLVSWINVRYEKVHKEYQTFYRSEYIVPESEDMVENL